MTSVNRATREIIGWTVMSHPQRSERTFQTVIDQAPAARVYFSDAFGIYQVLQYPAGSIHIPMLDRSQTYTVEGVNADLRTYLGRLKRGSRCFTRSLAGLRRAMKLFVHYYNLCQVYRLEHNGILASPSELVSVAF